MGMFDTVVIEGLKLKAPKEVTTFLKANSAEFPSEFQTKDLDCFLATYTINSKGIVYKDIRKPTGKKIPYEPVFKRWGDERPFLEKIYWNIKNKNNNFKDREYVDEYKSVRVKSKITNTFTMLSYDLIGGRYLSLDFEVNVVDGKVKKVKLLNWEIESEKDAKERIQRDDEFKKNIDISIAKRNELRSKWYYPVLKEIYNPFVFFSRIIIQHVCNKIISWSYRWTGV